VVSTYAPQIRRLTLSSSILLSIGFPLLLLGVRLMMVRNALRRTGQVSLEHANQLGKEGWILSVTGLIVLLIGILLHWLLTYTPAMAIINAGGLLIPLGIAQLIQWTVQRGRGTDGQVFFGAWVTVLIGAGVIAAYVIRYH